MAALLVLLAACSAPSDTAADAPTPATANTADVRATRPGLTSRWL